MQDNVLLVHIWPRCDVGGVEDYNCEPKKTAVSCLECDAVHCLVEVINDMKAAVGNAIYLQFLITSFLR